MNLPPLPSWDALHPLVVHFPIGLLLVAPVFVALGLIVPRTLRGFLISALTLMALGTAATWVAVATGEAAGELATRTPAISAALEGHEGLAEKTRTVFTALTLVFAALMFLPGILKRTPRRAVTVAVGAVFLAGYLGAAGLLANTAHEGGRLVHAYGVHALMPAESGTVVPAVENSGLMDLLNESGDKDSD